LVKVKFVVLNCKFSANVVFTLETITRLLGVIFRRDPRATETEPRKSGGRTRDPDARKGNGRRVGTPYGREDDGRTEEDKSGENWRELDERKGKEGEGSWRKRRRKLRKTYSEPATGKTQTEAEYYPEEIRVEGGGERTWKRCEERSGKTDPVRATEAGKAQNGNLRSSAVEL
jgi:hypothetical protein